MQIITGIIGVLGVITGVLLDRFFGRSDTKKERKYLAISVAFALEEFGLKCQEIVFDRRDSHITKIVHGEIALKPLFDPRKLEVNWRAINADLVHQIFELVNETHIAKASMEATFMIDGAEDAVNELRLSYAELGVKAFEIAERLREIGELPKAASYYSSIYRGLRSELQKRKEIQAKWVKEAKADWPS